MILGYCIASYVVVFFVLKWYARNANEFCLLSGLLWLMSPLLVPVLIVVALAWAIGLIITENKQ